ncbi:unnamed protein product [Polarella glacialis]|uniref:Uncharacterized protein n=1 Tax=Polarella glacialis TaxID=89957 RepID=A0A813HJ74_POLGL|nr:unnamed protein product [Polarella glacialis]CAE8708680.1 unnamed protein product [Polarella glacialis]
MDGGMAGRADSMQQPRLVAVNGALLLLSNEQDPHADPEASMRRKVFGSRYLSRQAWIRPCRYDVPATLDLQRQCSLEDVLASLRRIPSKHWRNSGRDNVRPTGAVNIDSITLGLVSSRSTNGLPLPSMKTWLYLNLCRQLLSFWKAHIQNDPAAQAAYGSRGRELMCTSIQLNRNYAAREHVDGNNLGPSWLIATGDWQSGGELFVEDPEGCEEHRLTSDVSSHNGRLYRFGDRCRGTTIDVRNRWVRFDGRRMHFVHDFEGGDRFSLVFFASARHAAAPPCARSFLEGLGFPLPTARGLPVRPPSERAECYGRPSVKNGSLPAGSVLKLDSMGRILDFTPVARPRALSERGLWSGLVAKTKRPRALAVSDKGPSEPSQSASVLGQFAGLPRHAAREEGQPRKRLRGKTRPSGGSEPPSAEAIGVPASSTAGEIWPEWRKGVHVAWVVSFPIKAAIISSIAADQFELAEKVLALCRSNAGLDKGALKTLCKSERKS